jgi:hypothetical protein
MSDGLEVVTFQESLQREGFYVAGRGWVGKSGEYVPASVARDLLAALRAIAGYDPQEVPNARPDDWDRMFAVHATGLASVAINKATKGARK